MEEDTGNAETLTLLQSSLSPQLFEEVSRSLSGLDGKAVESSTLIEVAKVLSSQPDFDVQELNNLLIRLNCGKALEPSTSIEVAKGLSSEDDFDFQLDTYLEWYCFNPPSALAQLEISELLIRLNHGKTFEPMTSVEVVKGLATDLDFDVQEMSDLLIGLSYEIPFEPLTMVEVAKGLASDLDFSVQEISDLLIGLNCGKAFQPFTLVEVAKGLASDRAGPRGGRAAPPA